MADDCVITERVSGGCASPPSHDAGALVHIVGLKIYCEAHCTVCHPQIEWRGGKAVVGEQTGLFE